MLATAARPRVASAPPPPPSPALARSRWAEASAFAIGATLVFTLPLVGAIPVAEFVTLGWAAWLGWRRLVARAWPHPLLRSPAFRWLALGLALSLAGYVCSDLVRGTAASDVLRGWARLAFLGVDILVLTYLLGRDWRLLRWLIAGFMVGVVTSVLTVGPHADDYWKFGFAYPLSFLVPLLVPASRRWLLCLLLAGLGVVHLQLGARSLGGICLVAAATLWLPSVGRRGRWLALAVSLVAAGWVIQQLYGRLDVAQRAEGSTTERAAMLAFATESIRESPLIGQGSWFTKGKRVQAFFARRAELRDEVDRVDLTDDSEVVIHSQVLVAFAEGGVLGGMFFVAFGGLLAWGLWFAATHEFTLRPLVLVLLLNGAWDYAMSPFSGSERIFIALSCAMVVALRGAAAPTRSDP